MGFVEPSAALLLLLVLPLSWAVAALVAGRETTVARVAIAGSGGLVALTAALAGRLALSPKGHVLGQHLGVVARTGQLNLSVDLWMDSIGAVLAVTVALVAAAATLHTAWARRDGARERFGYGGLLAFAAMTTVLAEGWAPFVVGLQVATLATFALSRGLHETPARVAIGADVAIVAAFVLVFCGAMGFETEAAQRFAVVPGAAGVTAKARLTMSTYVGAHVVAEDGAPLPGEPLRSPFSIEVDPGAYTLRVEPGIASPDVIIPSATLAAGREHVIHPTGPSTSFRVLAERESFEDPRAPVATIVIAFIAILVRLGAATARRASRTPSGALAVLPVAVLALRIAPLLDATSARVVAGGAAAAALFLGGLAASSRDAPSALLSALSSAIATAIAAAALGERAGALVIAAVAPLAFAGCLAALESRGDVRWLGAGCAAACGLLPLCGTSAGQALVFARCFQEGTFGWLLAAVIAFGLVLSALACFRVYDAAIRSRLDQGTRGQGLVALALGVAALALGALVGAGGAMFGGNVASIAQRAAPSVVAIAPRYAWAALGVSLLAALAGVILARRLAENERVLDALGAPSVASARVAVRLASVTAFLSRGVQTMDRDVIDDMASFAGETLTKTATFMRRGESRVGTGFVATRVSALRTRLWLRMGLDDPRRLERVRSAAVLVMVAFLGVLVLSSVFFR